MKRTCLHSIIGDWRVTCNHTSPLNMCFKVFSFECTIVIEPYRKVTVQLDMINNLFNRYLHFLFTNHHEFLKKSMKDLNLYKDETAVQERLNRICFNRKSYRHGPITCKSYFLRKFIRQKPK